MMVKSKPQPMFKTKKKPKSLKLKKPEKKNREESNLETMSVSNFMSGGFLDETNEKVVKKVKYAPRPGKEKKAKAKQQKVKKKVVHEQRDNDSETDGEEEEEDEERSHKQDLKKLEKTDPEFYKFLKENDQNLLNFEDDGESNDDDDDVNDEKFHKLPSNLEVGSDEEDGVDDEDDVEREIDKSRSNQKVTLKMVEKWTADLQTDKTNKTLSDVVDGFHAALLRVAPQEDAACVYRVDGAAVFNGVLRMCIVGMAPALRKVLKLPQGSKKSPTQCKHWVKVRRLLRDYFTDLSQLMRVTSPSMLTVLLKHLHEMTPYVVCYSSIAHIVLKRLVQLWCTNEDVVRVLAFLCALRIAGRRRSLLPSILKMMYLGYVKNTKFVTNSSKPGVNFMRRSLVELFLLDDHLGYQHAFLYIRQLAIHLRNAVTLKKKESYQTVYNWQYVSSVELWADAVGQSNPASPMRSLLYPLVQITLGAVKLMPSPQYFPLRFHCLRSLTTLADRTGTFIPVLPYLVEILADYDFNKKHKSVSMKPLDLTCALRCSRSQMQQNGFKDAVLENLHACLLEYLNTECHRLSFPDLIVPAVIQMKQFLKKCKNANYCKKIKTILDKAQENGKWVEAERNKETIRLDDVKGVEALEVGLRNKKPPLKTFYDSWKKVHILTQAKKSTNNDKIGDIKLPVIHKKDKTRQNEVARTADGRPELFPSDDEDDDDGLDFLRDVEDGQQAKKRKVNEKKTEETFKAVKKVKREKEEDEDMDGIGDGLQDLVQDLDLDEFYDRA